MTIQEFKKHFEKIAPPAIAWKGDNVGLQIGRESDTIRGIIVSLDATMEVAQKAEKNNANLIITHHPLFFNPIKNISDQSRVGELALFLAKNNINLYSAHTNLDSVRWGVNDILAKTIGLLNVRILSPLKDSLLKITVFVPLEHCDAVANEMHEAGGGTFSKYDQCSFRSEGSGTFRGLTDAKPFVGTVGSKETTSEIRLEMLCETWKITSVLHAMRKSHPFEEIAYDIYPLANLNTDYGLGAIGELKGALSPSRFLELVQTKLRIPSLRYSKGKGNKIKTVAVCGGSGIELMGEALRLNADAFVTADVKYHSFQENEKKIWLIDAGHCETEQLVLPVLTKKLHKIFSNAKQSKKISITTFAHNPVHYFTGMN